MSNQTKCDKCKFDIVTWFFDKHYSKCDGKGPHRKSEGKCKYCSGQFTSKTLGAHIISCKLNPARENWIKSMRARSRVIFF